MRIGEIARATGLDTETVRYYEKSGLLPPPSRDPNGYRRYGPAHLERLAFVRHCRSLDMALVDVKRLLGLIDRPGADCGDVDRMIDGQLQRVRARLASMKALERQLARLRTRCGSRRSAGACGILRELVSAAHGEACACHAAPARRPLSATSG